MNLIKLEIYIINFDELSKEEIKNVIENEIYPNRCISPRVLKIQAANIGKWHDDHHLNMNSATIKEFRKYFQEK